MALLVGGGAPSALAACAVTQSGGTVATVSNSSPAGDCILVNNNALVTGNVVNTGVLTAAGPAAPSTTGITIDNSTINGTVTNSGTINASVNGIAIVNNATVLGGIANSTTISAGSAGIIVGGSPSSTSISLSATVSTFAGSITNAGTISGAGAGILVGGNPRGGGPTSLTVITVSTSVSNFAGGITNSGTISVGGPGIQVGGNASVVGFSDNVASVAISTFTGSITNSGTISGGVGVQVGGTANAAGATFNDAFVTISTVSGGITNGGQITGASAGILVGGDAVANIAALDTAKVTIATFGGNITNSGTITAMAGNGIWIGGHAGGGGGGNHSTNLTISTFVGGVTNAGAISANGAGVFAGGNVDLTGATNSASLAISVFSGGITNAGTIAAGTAGIRVGANAALNGTEIGTDSVTIGAFGGGIVNTKIITASAGAGILVGGNATITSGTDNHTSVAISSFGGGISNAGTISASGAGIWVGGSASIATGLNDSASVTISTFSGGITNAGTITAGGAGILIGGTTMVGSGAGESASVTISSFSGNVSNAAAIVGLTGIQVTGGVTFVGGAAIVNSGNVTGIGGTAIDVSAATSPVTIDQNAGTISGAIRLSANADVLNVSGGVIAGNIVGQGTSNTVNFNPGAGNTFTYAAPFGFSGVNQVNINSGTVVLNGTNSATTIDVNGGTLAGTGTLNPSSLLSINSGGAFSPGTPGAPGTSMTIGGNLAFQSGALYVVYLNPSASSMANVTGTASLAGAVQANFATGAYMSNHYDILHSAGLNGTTFNSLTTVNPPNFSVSLSYSATDVFLDLTATLGLSGGFNINQQNVATALNTFFNNGGTLPPGFASLFGLSGVQLANALTQLDGEDATGAEKGAFSLTSQFLNLMLDPFVDGRGDQTIGGALGFAPGEANNLPPEVALAYASVLKAPPRPAFGQGWTTWAAAFGGTNQSKGDPIVGSTNITASAYGLAAGVDYHVTPDTIFGIALAGGGTNWGLEQGLGTGRSDALMAGVYGVTHAGPAYVAAALSFANNWFTTNRTALADQLTAKFDGQSFGARLEGGYRFAVPVARGFVGLTPYAALQSQTFHTPSYSETDLTGGGFGLSYNAMTGSDTRSELGLRLDAPTVLGGRPLVLRGKLAWAHDWVSNPVLNATFEALPGAGFTVFGAPIPHDSALASAGAQLFITPRWSLAAKFDGAFAPGSQTYAGTGTLRYSW